MDVGTDSAIRDVLTESGLFFERYHGGTLTGNYCKKFCSKSEEMMKACQKVCMEKIQQMSTNGSLPKYAPTVDDCKALFGTLGKLLSMVDVVFSDLNLLAPTNEEIIQVEKNLYAME